MSMQVLDNRFSGLDRSSEWPIPLNELVRELEWPGSTNIAMQFTDGVFPAASLDDESNYLVPAEVGVKDLNNLHLLTLPTIRQRTLDLITSAEDPGLTYGMLFLKAARADIGPGLTPQDFTGYSIKWLGMTPEAVSDELERTALIFASRERLHALGTNWSKRSDEMISEWRSIGEQVYLEMRRRGFSHFDLTR